MFKKSILKAIQNMTPDEKDMVRKALEDNNQMAKVDDEGVGETKVDNKEEVAEQKDENNAVNVSKGEENGTGEDAGTQTEDEETTDETDNTGDQDEGMTVREEINTAMGISVSDLVTKQMLEETLNAMNAKMEAIIKENKDLKQERDNLHDKYERKDFGNNQRKGFDAEAKSANETFEEYLRQFMGK